MVAEIFVQSLGAVIVCGALAVVMDRNFLANMVNGTQREPLALYLSGIIMVAISVPLIAYLGNVEGEKAFMERLAIVLSYLMLLKGIVAIALPKMVFQLSAMAKPFMNRSFMVILMGGAGFTLLHLGGVYPLPF